MKTVPLAGLEEEVIKMKEGKNRDVLLSPSHASGRRVPLANNLPDVEYFELLPTCTVARRDISGIFLSFSFVFFRCLLCVGKMESALLGQ